MENLILFIISYLVGSIPFGLILTKFFLKKDVRKVGSGNIGATNVLRTGGKFLGLLTLFFDVTKGYLVTKYALTYYPEGIFIMSLLCFLGHIFPIWLKFKGGKGVAVYLGIILGVSFKLALVFIISWLIFLFIFKYSSLSSILSSLILIFYNYFYGEYFMIVFLVWLFILIVFTHWQNIMRIKKGKENKIKL
tara:strand:+ start:639 stop:1214 length:576 start_codon:yes stop_codon:yes gene_type:complete